MSGARGSGKSKSGKASKARAKRSRPEAKTSEAKAKGKAKAKAATKAKARSEAKEKKPSRLEKLLEQYRQEHPEEEMEERFKTIEAQVTALPAGLLCPFSVSIRGGRHNQRTIDEIIAGADGQKITKYSGTAIEDDEEELKNADSIKQFCYRVMRKVGVNSPHLGVIVPSSRRVDLYRAIAQVEANTARFNSTAKTCELVFSFRGPLESSGSSKSAEAVVLDQMARLLQQVDGAQHDDEEAILARAPQGSLPKGLTSKDVLTMVREDRRAIVARVRADLARKAVAEVAGFEFILPEEASIGLTESVEQIRMAAKAWNVGAQESEQAYIQALKATDLSGLTRQQEHLVAAAKGRREESLQEALSEGGVSQDELALHPLVDPDGKGAEGSGKPTGGGRVKKGSAKPTKLIDEPKKRKAS